MARKAEVIFVGDAQSVVRAARQAEAATAAFGSTATKVHGKVSRSFSGAAASAVKFAAATAGVAGVGIAFTKVASATVEFDKSMRNVNSIAQLNQRQFGLLEKQVLSLAGKTAQAPATLAKGLYDIVSSGYSASAGMKILAASAKAATAGLTTTETSTSAVVSVLNAYHRPASDAAKISDVLFQTVNRGVINFEDLSNSIGNILPVAASLGVNVNQVGAAISTMTKINKNADEVSTQLKQTMVSFIKPSKGMAEAIKATGAESGEALIKSKGFQGALEAVIGTTDGSKASIQKLFPNVRALGGVLELTGRNAKTAHDDLSAFKDVTGATDRALSQQSQSIAYQWAKIKSTISGVAISVGSVVVPAFSNGLQHVVRSIAHVETAFKGFLHNIDREKNPPNPIMKRMLGPDFKPEKAKSTFGAFAGTIGKAIKGAFESINWQGIGDTLSAGMSKAFNATGKLPAAISSGISLALSKVNTSDLASKMADVAVRMLATLADPSFWLSHWKQILSIVTLVIPAGKLLKIPGAEFLFKYVSKPVLKAFQFLATEGAKALGKGAVLIGKGLLDGLEKEFPKAIGAVKDFVPKAVGAIKGLPGKLKDIGSKSGSGIASGIGSGVRKVGEVVGQIVGKAVKVLAGLVGDFFSLGVRAVDRLTGGMASKAIGVAKEAASLGIRVLSRLKGLPGKLLDIGRNVVQGFINGITSKAGDIIDAIKRTITDKVPSFVKKALGIFSPSKLFEQFGRWTIEGYVRGLISSAGSVTDAANKALLYPLDAAITALNAKKDRLQKAWDRIDARAQRSQLLQAIATAKAGKSEVFGGSSSAGSVGSAKGMNLNKAKFSKSDLMRLWVAAGGPRSQANTAAAIALAESGGVAGVVNGIGATGLWQIYNGHGQVPGATDPFTNAKMAVAKYRGAGNRFTPWTTYTGADTPGHAKTYLQYLGGGSVASAAAKVAGAVRRRVVDPQAVKDAVKALKDFDEQAKRAKALARIDIKVANLQRLKAFKDAVAGIKSQVHDLAGQAAEAWRSMQDKAIDKTHDAAIAAIDNSAEAQQLRALQAQDAAEQDAKTQEQLNQDLEDAKKAQATATTDDEKKDAEKKLKDAQDAITDYQRGKLEDQLQASIDSKKKEADDAQQQAKDSLDQQTADYQAGLENQMGVLTDQLEKRKITYAQWAKQVNAILAQYGLSVSTDSGTEAAINSGPGPAGNPPSIYQGTPIRGAWGTSWAMPSRTPIRGTWGTSAGHRASGGWVYPGETYTVGELGREEFTPSVPGRITQASQSSGGSPAGINIERAYFTGSRAARAFADRLSFRARYG